MKTLWSTLSSKKLGVRKAPCDLDAALHDFDPAQSSFTLEMGGHSRNLNGEDILWMFVAYTCACCGMRERELRSEFTNSENAGESFFALYPRLKAVEVGEDVRNIGRIELMLHSGECLSIGMECSTKEEVSEFKMLTEAIFAVGSLIPFRQSGCKTRHNFKSPDKVQLEEDTGAAEEADRHMKELLETTQREQFALDSALRKKKQKRKAKVTSPKPLFCTADVSDDSQTTRTSIGNGRSSRSSTLSAFSAAEDQEHCTEEGTPMPQLAQAEKEADHRGMKAEEAAGLVEDESKNRKAKQVAEKAKPVAEKRACTGCKGKGASGQTCRAELLLDSESAEEGKWETPNARGKCRFKEEEEKAAMDEVARRSQGCVESQQTNDRSGNNEQPNRVKQLNEESKRMNNKQKRRKEKTDLVVNELAPLVTDEQPPLERSIEKVDKGTQTVATSCSWDQLHIDYFGEYKIDESLSASTPMMISPITTRPSCLMAYTGLPAKVLLSGSGYHSCDKLQFDTTNQGGSTDSLSEASTHPCDDLQCPSCVSVLLDCDIDGVQGMLDCELDSVQAMFSNSRGCGLDEDLNKSLCLFQEEHECCYW